MDAFRNSLFFLILVCHSNAKFYCHAKQIRSMTAFVVQTKKSIVVQIRPDEYA